MQATLDAAVIQEALRVALRLAPPMSGNVTIQADGAKMVMHSTSELARCSITLPGEVKGKAFFGVSPESLMAACKGHATLEVVYDKTMLSLKSGRYSSNLTTVDAIQIEDLDKEKGATWKVTTEQAAWLRSAVQAVALKPNALVTTFMPLTAKITDKAAFVSCFDNQRMAFTNDKEIKGELDVTLPLDSFSSILETFYKAPFRMTVGQSSLYVKNNIVDVQLSLPAQDDENQIGGDSVVAKAREALKTDGSEVTLVKSELTAFLDNARSVATKERSEVLIAVEAGKAKISVATTNGTSKIILKAASKAKINFAIDFEYLDEAVRKCPEELTVKVVQGAFLMFKTKTTHILVALNQEQ